MINPLLMKDEMCKLVREIKIQDHKQVLWKNVPNQKKFFLKIKMYNTSGANWFCCHLEFSRPKCIVVGLVTNYSGAAAAVDLVAVCRSSIKPGWR